MDKTILHLPGFMNVSQNTQETPLLLRQMNTQQSTVNIQQPKNTSNWWDRPTEKTYLKPVLDKITVRK